MDPKMKEYKRLRIKRQMLLADLRFLMWCKQVKLFPKSLRLKSPLDSLRVNRTVFKSNLSVLRAVIRDKRTIIDSNETRLYVLHLELSRSLPAFEWDRLETSSCYAAVKALKEKEEGLKKKRWTLVHGNNACVNKINFFGGKKGEHMPPCKGTYSPLYLKSLKDRCYAIPKPTQYVLEKLGIFKERPAVVCCSQEHAPPPPLGRPIVNLTPNVLSQEQISFLGMGSKLALGPTKRDGTLLVATVEKALEEVLEPAKSLARAKIIDICSKNTFSTSKHWKTVKNLKAFDDIVYLKADKGETMVLMQKEDYVTKMLNELEAGGYSKLKKDPSTSVISNLGKLVGAFKEPHLRDCKVKNPVAPRVFGQVKLHKAGQPLRLIVSGRRSPTSRLEKLIAGHLKKYVAKNPSFLKDSGHLVQILRSTEPLKEDEHLISLDIVKLFPSLPRDETLESVNQVLVNDPEINEGMRQDIIAALKFIFSFAFFRFQGMFYKCEKGSPIGSSVSPILAEIYLSAHENRSQNKVNEWPRLFLRYVDDHLAILKKGSKDTLIETLNSVCNDIQFTSEEAVEGVLPFLDVLITCKKDGFVTKVYRKVTASGVLVNSCSAHHPKQKSGVWSTLVHRAFKVCSNDVNLYQELETLKGLAQFNGFSPEVVDVTAKKLFAKEKRKESSSLQNISEVHKDFCVLPFFGKVSTRIGNILEKATKKKAAYFPLNKLGNVLFNSKDPLQIEEGSGIYKILCKCGSAYIGQTSRNFGKRIAEHKAALVNFVPEASAVARHFWQKGCDEGIDWMSSKVIIPSRFSYGLQTREHLEICLQHRINPSGIMNDQENTGRFQPWMGLQGSWLFPSKNQEDRLPFLPNKTVCKMGAFETLSKTPFQASNCVSVQPLQVLQTAGVQGQEEREEATQIASTLVWRGRLRKKV